MTRDRLAILGVGILGGSVARAARAAGVVSDIVGYDPAPEAIRVALSAGIIDRAAPSAIAALEGATLIVLAVPVDRLVGLLRDIAPHCRPGALVTDVGSTKGFVREAETIADLPFVGSHPLAGSEKSGPSHARADLFRGRLVVLTPTENTAPVSVDRLERFWRALGAVVLCMDPDAHDQAVAWTSHLPHLVSYALAGCLPPEFGPLTATGFRDTTRLAGSDPALWLSIFAANRPALLEAVAGFRQHLDELEQAIRTGDDAGLLALLSAIRARREQIVR